MKMQGFVELHIFLCIEENHFDFDQVYKREITKSHLYSLGPCKTELMIQFTYQCFIEFGGESDNSRETSMENKRKKANRRGLNYRAGHSFTTTTAHEHETYTSTWGAHA